MSEPRKYKSFDYFDYMFRLDDFLKAIVPLLSGDNLLNVISQAKILYAYLYEVAQGTMDYTYINFKDDRDLVAIEYIHEFFPHLKARIDNNIKRIFFSK